MVLPATAVPALIGAGGSILGGILGGRQKGPRTPKETKMQKTQRKLVDDLLASLDGKGSYNDLYTMDEDTFNKSFVQPAQSRFQNRIAPQIQQSYIASGQQRGTGLDDQLLRAGVDLNSELDKYYYQFQQDALNRKQNSINSILGSGAGAAAPQNNQASWGDAIKGGISGYMSSNAFQDNVKDIFKKDPQQEVVRKGFESTNYL